ncbi:tRNA pseudouridine synthase B [Geosporobacter subterraneus DSM 17957]|uniref:tRNA pseudouridine synthase B n=1 Tax=Geosporobacter subterraneus DSM 17957 TaxID=1121919 RepID=A0A1M6E0E2_9FIRM|nr:tRNA pseudouridine(55) synthase TruB [Geosporobacter subterraneus]SHI78869.1 tRNA pseudouridine synthase B [Geosporobacter subterraneus DSM 17957]
MDGIINLLKPPHMTSHDAVGYLRRLLKTKKVGHTGTLDPMAAGVLPICIGNATKVSQFLLNDAKAYRCELTLGCNTDTQDRWGTVTKVGKREVSQEEIIRVFNTFKGEILQYPPMYSALKHRGKKLYELARAGKTIEREARKVTIYELNILDIRGHKVLFDVCCSKGTYVRTLCEDIGNKLNTGGHMSFLLRTASGRFKLGETVTLEDLQETAVEDIERNYLFPIDYPLYNLPNVYIRSSSIKYLLNGNDMLQKNILRHDPLKENEYVKIYAEEKFMAIGIVKTENQFYIDIQRVFN